MGLQNRPTGALPLHSMSERDATAAAPVSGEGYLRIVDEHSAGPKVTPEPAPSDDRLIGLWAIGASLGTIAALSVAWWIRRHVRITIR